MEGEEGRIGGILEDGEREVRADLLASHENERGRKRHLMLQNEHFGFFLVNSISLHQAASSRGLEAASALASHQKKMQVKGGGGGGRRRRGIYVLCSSTGKAKQHNSRTGEKLMTYGRSFRLENNHLCSPTHETKQNLLFGL